jgi:predicted nucleotidyltransferase
MREVVLRESPIVNALFPGTRGKILTAAFGQPDKEWYVSELAEFLHTQSSSLQREVDALHAAGVLEQRRDGRRLYLKPDRQSPVFSDLKSLFDKTAGLIPLLQREMEDFGESIRIAFVYGSVARSEETSASDVDLMIVGSIGLSDMVPVLRRAEKLLGRPINPTVYSSKEFQKKLLEHDHFLTSVIKKQKTFVKGGLHELAAIARKPRRKSA